MALQTINIGTLPNDGEGDTLRTAFAKINNNFATLESSTTLTAIVATTANTGNVVVFSANANSFTQGTFQINSQQLIGNANSAVYSNNSQNVTLNVSKVANSVTINHTAYSTIISGSAIINGYNVIIANVIESNVAVPKVQIVVSPDTANLGANANMMHTVSYRTS